MLRMVGNMFGMVLDASQVTRRGLEGAGRRKKWGQGGVDIGSAPARWRWRRRHDGPVGVGRERAHSLDCEACNLKRTHCAPPLQKLMFVVVSMPHMLDIFRWGGGAAAVGRGSRGRSRDGRSQPALRMSMAARLSSVPGFHRRFPRMVLGGLQDAAVPGRRGRRGGGDEQLCRPGDGSDDKTGLRS